MWGEKRRQKQLVIQDLMEFQQEIRNTQILDIIDVSLFLRHQLFKRTGERIRDPLVPTSVCGDEKGKELQGIAA